jgi:hypothetical protein
MLGFFTFTLVTNMCALSLPCPFITDGYTRDVACLFNSIELPSVYTGKEMVHLSNKISYVAFVASLGYDI